MTLCLLLSLLFVWKQAAARWVLALTVLTVPLGVMIFVLSGNVHLLGLAHLILWTPLLIYLLKNVGNRSGFNPQSLFGIWVMLLIATIGISLVFDVRDVILVALEQK